MNDDGQFTLRSPDGEIIAKGPLSMLMERIPQSVPRLNAEQAIQAAAKAVAREQRLDARADSLDQREAEVQAPEDAIFADQVRSFCDSVLAVGRRLDALEEVRRQERLADEIAAADAALKALQADEGDLEPKESPNEHHAEEIEVRGGSTSAEEAISTSDQFAAGGSPSLPQRATEPYRLVEPMGALPSKSDAADVTDLATFGRTFLCARDRRAARRAIRLATRR
jgi:hypothetical protein